MNLNLGQWDWGKAIAGLALIVAGLTYFDQRSKDSKAASREEIGHVVSAELDKKFDNFEAKGSRQIESQIRAGIDPLKTSIDNLKNDQANLDARLRTAEKDASNLRGELDGMTKAIRALKVDFGAVIQGRARQTAELMPEDLVKEIPTVRSIFRLAAKYDTPLDTEYYQIIRRKLAMAPVSGDPGYWVLVSQLISDESARLGPPVIHPTEPTGPACDHCTVQGGVMILDEMRFTNSLIKNAVLIYNGGAFEIRHSVFVDCLFLIRIATPPPENGRRFAQSLMAAVNLRQVTTL